MYLSTKQAAASLKVAPQTLRNWLDSGLGPSADLTPTGRYRFLESDLEAFKKAMRDRAAEGKRQAAA